MPKSRQHWRFDRRPAKAAQAEALFRKAIGFGRRLRIPSYLSGMLIELVRLLLEQERAVEASPFYEEALEMMSTVEGQLLAGEDTRFDAYVLGIRLRHALGQLIASAAATELRALLHQVTSPVQQATIHYEPWRLVPDNEEARTAAAALYRSQYAETGLYLYRRRYQELTGETLPIRRRCQMCRH